MLNYVTKSVTIDAAGTKADNWDFDIEVAEKLPKVKRVFCLNDMSSLRNKVFLTLVHNSKKIKFFDEVDCHRLSSAWQESLAVNYAGERYSYSITNNDTSAITLKLMFELEYPL